MKKSFFFLFGLIWNLTLFAQKEDYTWIFGYHGAPPLHKNFLFKFKDTLEIEETDKNMVLGRVSASICDTSGQLKMFTNGCQINTGDGQYIQNSANLNPGWLYNEFCVDDTSGYNTFSTHMILQQPNIDSIYYLFHVSFFVQFNPQKVYQDPLRYTKIHMSPYYDSTWVTDKNSVIVSDSIDDGGLTAVRHANGRDWWVVCQKQFSNKFYIVLFSPDGISLREQEVGEPILYTGYPIPQLRFSPDGSKLVKGSPIFDLYMYDFDRCSGELSNQIHIPLDEPVGASISGGVEFSADGHYLYYADTKRIYQFDMTASNIAESRIIVATLEDQPSGCPFGGALGPMQIGPNGIIYCRSDAGQYCMHQIKKPEKSGISCEPQQYFYRNIAGIGGFPNLPNFRLGPIDGSACDTLGINNVPLAGFRYDPLPASPNGGGVVEFTSVSWYEPTDWLWDFGDGQQSTERNPVHTFNTSGAHDVCLTVSNQYGSDVKCKTVWVGTTSAKDVSDARGLVKVYPNPASEVLNLDGTPPNAQVRLFNSLGQLMFEQKYVQGGIKLAGFQSGLYSVQIQDENGVTIHSQQVQIVK